MRIRLAARLGLLMVLALVVAVMVAAPVGAKKKVWEGQTCAQVYGTDSYMWDTSDGGTDPDTLTLTLTKAAATACIDLTTGGGDFTVKFTTNKDANVTVFYASVRDSVPGSQCVGVQSRTTEGVLLLEGVPASAADACGDPDTYPDGDEALALWVGAQFKGKPGGSVDVDITYTSDD
jgi:hypothetical protein